MSDSNGSMQTFRASWHRGRVMSDVVQRLRAVAGERYSEGANSGGTAGLLEDAATEIERLRTRLKELEGQEPVAWMTCDSAGNNIRVFDTRKTANDMATRTGGRAIPLYTRPPDAVPKGWRLCSLSLGRFPDENHLN